MISMTSIIPHIRSYVCRGNRFTPAQRSAWEKHWAHHRLDASQLVEAPKIFARNTMFTLEVGFGNGNNLLKLAQTNPDAGFVGIEVYRPGIGRLLNDIAEHKVCNIRIVYADVVEALASPPPSAIFSRVLILFPDPWPKKRHHKRRLITPEFCNRLVPWMKPNATLFLATDWQNYAEQMRGAIAATPNLENLTPDNGFCERPGWCLATAFEQQARYPVKNLLCRRI